MSVAPRSIGLFLACVLTAGTHAETLAQQPNDQLANESQREAPQFRAVFPQNNRVMCVADAALDVNSYEQIRECKLPVKIAANRIGKDNGVSFLVEQMFRAHGIAPEEERSADIPVKPELMWKNVGVPLHPGAEQAVLALFGSRDLLQFRVEPGSRSVSKLPFEVALDQGLYEKYGVAIGLRMPEPDFDAGINTLTLWWYRQFEGIAIVHQNRELVLEVTETRHGVTDTACADTVYRVGTLDSAQALPLQRGNKTFNRPIRFQRNAATHAGGFFRRQLVARSG